MSFRITALKCNHMVCPVGIDDIPYFSYRLVSDKNDETQSEYRITVSASGESNAFWDSGYVKSDRQILIKYDGTSLLPQTRYLWKVYVINQNGEKTESECSFFETGRMNKFAWNAKWITSDPKYIAVGNTYGDNSTAPYMRREFDITKPVKEATLYISGIGYYECFINGVTVKDTVLDPAFTEYDKTVMYKTHKITNLRQGKNAIGVSLGDGFYNADTEDVWNFYTASWRDHDKCILILNIKYTDGTSEEIVSDKTFKGTTGPIISNHMRSESKYDARRELGGWTLPGYDDSSWDSVTVTKSPGGALTGQYTTPIKVVSEFTPAAIKRVSDTVIVVDAGMNTTGWAKISLTADAGTTLMLKYGEVFTENLEHKNNLYGCLKSCEKDNFQTDYYTAKGNGKEVWHPVFKYHGFRYIIIKCESGIPSDLKVTIQEVRTAFDVAGGFECSDETINKIQDITCRSTRTNFHNMPTDCPHREKNGWTGDAQLSAEQLLFNFNSAAAYDRWMDDVIRAQRPSGQLPGIIPSTGWGFNWGSGPAWDSVCAVIPYNMYLYCSDTRVIEKMYPVVKKYLTFCDTMADNGLCAFGLGDWCPPPERSHKQCELQVTDTAYYYLDAKIAAKMAEILGISDEAAAYAEKAKFIRNAFRSSFIKSTDQGPELINCTKCQTSLACVLYYGMAEPDEKAFFIKELINEIHIADDHLDVGILGAKYIGNVLIEAGEAELWLKAVENPTYPSFADMLNKGATTLWEDWNGANSQNHHMFGDVSACFYKALAGINPDEKHPGFKNTIFRPQFVSSIDYAKAWHMSPYGMVASEWKRENESVILNLTIPANCTGELLLPSGMTLSTGESYAKLSSGVHSIKIRNAQ